MPSSRDDVRTRAPGQRLFSLVGAFIGVGLGTVGVASVLSPAAAGVCVGAGVALLLTEVAALSRLPATVGLVLGGLAVGGVVVFADGVVDLSLPGLVVGGALGLLVAGAARYAEHVVAVEGPVQPVAAALARVWLPWRDLFLALGGRPLRQAPAPALPSARSPSVSSRR